MIDFKAMPPVAALRALAAFAESGSVVRAADLLNVSHPAVSQQLKALEAWLDVPLFDRRGQVLALTPEGKRLADQVVKGFSAISQVVAELTGSDAERPLTLTTTPTFASAWLVPRLPDFRKHNPGIDIMIDASEEDRPLEPGGIDLAIRYGNGDWPGLESQLLLATPVVAVGAPKLLEGVEEGDLEALAQLPWLEEMGSGESTAFLQRHGLSRGEDSVLTGLPGNILLDAARDGQGLAVIARAFVEPDIAAGRLRVIYRDSEREGYHLLQRPGLQRPAARAFARWALKQAESARREV